MKVQPLEKPKKERVVGLIGCGAIGTLIAHAVEQEIVNCDKLLLYDHKSEKADALQKVLKFPAAVVESVDEMLKFKPKVIVEAASQQAANAYVGHIAAANVDIIVMSTGALLSLNEQSSRVHVPPGAIGGLDAIRSAALTRIDEIVLTSRKNPQAFGMVNKNAKLVYEGSAEEAAKRFPREMNVAATLALTVKPAKVRVQVLSDPTVQRNTHEIQVKWKFGEMLLRFANDPHPKNPHTSALAAWSAIKLLKTLIET